MGQSGPQTFVVSAVTSAKPVHKTVALQFARPAPPGLTIADLGKLSSEERDARVSSHLRTGGDGSVRTALDVLVVHPSATLATHTLAVLTHPDFAAPGEGDSHRESPPCLRPRTPCGRARSHTR